MQLVVVVLSCSSSTQNQPRLATRGEPRWRGWFRWDDRRRGSSSRKARRGGCIPSRLLRKCSAATSSRLQAGGHRVGALLRAHGLGRASEERFQGKRLGRQQSSVLAASKQSVNGSPFHGNHHGMGQPQRCLLPRRGIGQLQRCLLPTSPPPPPQLQRSLSVLVMTCQPWGASAGQTTTEFTSSASWAPWCLAPSSSRSSPNFCLRVRCQ